MNKEELIELRNKVLKLKQVNEIETLLPKMNCYDFLYQCNKDRLDNRAINYLGNVITYRQLFELIDTAAISFVKAGVKKGDYVSVSMLSTPEGIISFYALNKIGAVSHMVNPASSADEIEKFLNSVNSKLYVTMDLFYSERIKNAVDKTNVDKVIITSLMDSIPNYLNMDKVKYEVISNLKRMKNPINKDSKCVNWNSFIETCNPAINVESIYEPNMNSCIAYTSGSTGVSKAVLCSNEAMNSMPIQMGMTDQTFAPNDVIFNSMPIWIYYSLVNNIHDPLCLGVSVALDPIFNSKKVSKRLKQYNFNHWNTIPAYVDDMCKDKKIKNMDLSFLKSITTGGDYLTGNLKDRADALLKNCNSTIKVGQGYGASEVLGSFSYTYEKTSTPGSVGKPLVGNKIKIVDLETKKELGSNKVGELYLYSPTVMKEYYNNEEVTAETLVKDENGIVWYKTGDLAHVSEDGELFIDGRIRRIVLTKDDEGFPAKIIPDKIKKELLLNDKVEKCEIITVPDKKSVNKPIAFIQLKSTFEENDYIIKELNEYCYGKLPSYMIPAEIRVLDKIPLTPSLKPDWNKMEEIYNADTNIKQKVKRIFS